MRKNLFCLLVLISCPVFADWVMIGKNEEGRVFFNDPKTLRIDGGLVKVWELQNFKPEPDGAQSYRMRKEYDCKKERFRLISISSHTGSMASGQVIDSQTQDNSTWHEIAPKTVNEALFRASCK
jgi:hypothetical protein